MRMFFFGSLMDRELLALVIGRPVDGLIFADSAIRGFERRRAQGESFPIIVPHPGGWVEGLLVEGLTPADIDRIQFYESDDYALRPFDIETAAGRLEAQVFLPTEKLKSEPVLWDYDAWLATERPMCMALAEELMSHYGRLTYEEYNRLWPEMKERAHRRFSGEPLPCKHAVGER